MFYLYCVCLLFGAALAQDDPIVNTTQGQVQGALATDGNYFVFYGVHYAGSTSGTNRFKAPTPAPQYPGVYHAIDNTIVCAYPTPGGLVGVEDCLILNIHTKNTTVLKPVMVILLGEEYASVDPTMYSYRRLVQADIVVVTMNYRLSFFGFLCLGVPDAPGNAGLKDVMHGLRWIKDNIAGFGGDPNNVILFGHGSGAAMADLITLSPSSSGLVHKAIIQSGSALAPWAVAYEPIQYARRFAEKLSYTDKTPQELAQKLVSTDISLLSPALFAFEFLNNSALFAPCLENPELSGSFLTEAPISIIRSGNFSHIPVLYGYTDREGTIRATQAAEGVWLQKMQENFTNFIQVDLAFKSIENKTAVANDIKHFYFQSTSVSMATIRDYLSYHGDTMIIVSVIRGAKERAVTSRADIRLMEFAYRGTLNSDWIYPQIPIDGVRHGGLLSYVFDYDLKPSDEEARASLVRRYTLFAKTGNPTEGTTHTVWNPIDTFFYYLLISGDSDIPSETSYGEESRTDPHSQRMTFWNNLYNMYYEPPTLPTSSADKLLCVSVVLVLAQVVARLL